MRKLLRRAAAIAVNSVAVTVLAACAQLAGIDDTSGLGMDATGAHVSLQLEQVSIGATVERSPAVLTGPAADYLVPDPMAERGTRAVRSTVTGVAMDTYTADLVTPTPIRLMLPSLAQPVIIDLPTPMIHAFYAIYEHRNPMPAPANATIAVAATSDVPQPISGGSTFQFYSVGTWAHHGVTPPAMDTTALSMGPVPWSSFVTPTGEPASDALTPADPVFLLRYEGAISRRSTRSCPSPRPPPIPWAGRSFPCPPTRGSTPRSTHPPRPRASHP